MIILFSVLSNKAVCIANNCLYSYNIFPQKKKPSENLAFLQEIRRAFPFFLHLCLILQVSDNFSV